ncbi:MAG: LAGLIDADG family homing endonuclease, partial [Candidatus Aenigmatarchaeota archaeon]
MCVGSNSLVITDKGIKRIKEIHNPMNIIGYKDGFGFYKVIEKVETERSTLLEINHNLQISEEHTVFIFTEDGFKEVKGKDLKIGDFLILPRSLEVPEKPLKLNKLKPEKVYTIKNPDKVKRRLQQIFSIKNEIECKNYIGIGARHLRKILNSSTLTSLKIIRRIENLIGKIDYEIKETVKHKNVKEVNELTEELAQILGYFVGDGSKDFYNNSIRIRDERKEVLEFYSSLFKNVFNIKPKISKVKDKNCFELKFANKYVTNVLKFLINKLHNLFFERKNIIKAFIKGLFDAEGSVSNVVSLTMKERDFLVFIKLLLLRLGIHSTITTIRNKNGLYYRLLVNPNRFREINFTSSEKNEKLFINKKFIREEKIPLKRKKLEQLLEEIGIDWKFNHSENNISYSELEELCKKYEEAN